MTRIRMIMLSLLAVFAVGAVASASASAASLEWEVCEELAGVGVEPPLKFDNHNCNSEVKPLAERKWEWKLLAAGQTRKVVSLGEEFKLVGGPVEIKCLHVHDEGHITGGKPGTDLALRILFLGCTTNKAGCKVKSASLPAKAGEIEVKNISTKLITESSGVEGDLFEGTLTGGEKVFVTLEFGEAEVTDNKLATKCGETVPLTTKVTGNVAAETVGGKLVFPSTPLKSSTIKAFGVSVKLVGEDEQAVVQSFTETISEGWAVRAS